MSEIEKLLNESDEFDVDKFDMCSYCEFPDCSICRFKIRSEADEFCDYDF